MEFICEGLPQYGLVLVQPSSLDYAPLLADIERRLDQPADGAPPIPEKFRPRISEPDRSTSAILLNKSPKTIAAMQAVWRFETVSGGSYRHSRGMLSPKSLLLRFGRSEESLLKLYGYWHTILPGSKRYLTESGMVGDNTDVRPPTPDEEWQGGVVAGIAGSGSVGVSSRDEVKQVTLVLDGVFFLGGEFVGPNRERLFEQTVADAEAHFLVARTARNDHNKGLTPGQILAEIERTTGPAPEHPTMNIGFRNPDATPEEFRRAALQQIAFQLANRRKFPQLTDDERTVHMNMGWTETVLPHFRKG